MEVTEFLEFLKELEAKRETKKMNRDEFILNHSHINYCECIIYKDGLVAYVNPSHTENLIRESGKTKQELNNIIPITESPLHFLINYTGCIAVWTDMYIEPQQGITSEQQISLNKLLNAKLTHCNPEVLNIIYN